MNEIFNDEKNPRQARVAELLAEAKEIATWMEVDIETVLKAYPICASIQWHQVGHELTGLLMEEAQVILKTREAARSAKTEYQA